MMYALRPEVPEGMAPFLPWWRETLRLWTGNWRLWLTMGLIYTLAYLPFIIEQVYGLVTGGIAGMLLGDLPDGLDDALYVLDWILTPVQIWLYFGLILTAFKQLHGEPVCLADLLPPAEYAMDFIHLAAYYLSICFVLTVLAVLCGPIAFILGIFCNLFFFIPLGDGVWDVLVLIRLFIVPGIIMLCMPLMLEQKCHVSDAVSESWEMIKVNPALFILFPLSFTLLECLGLFILALDTCLTTPLFVIASVVAYHHMYTPPRTPRGRTRPTDRRPPPPPYVANT